MKNLRVFRSRDLNHLCVNEPRELMESVDPVVTAFRPNRLVRGGRIQTIASSYPPRNLPKVLAGEQVVVVDAGKDETGYDKGVRLVGYYNQRHSSGASKGLVISLHGWEGSSHSAHNLLLGNRLLAEGYDLFRLNLRDHGPLLHVNPYALNRGVFRGTLLQEAHCAVQQVAAWANDLPVYLVGPSLGGNVALRVAMLHQSQPIHNLRRVVAISPVLNPSTTADRIDDQYPFRRYFRDRWVRSIMIKATLFPDLYDFGPIAKMSRLRPMTDWFAHNYTDFADADDYFYRYAILGDALVGIPVATTVLTAADDPVIDVQDFEQLTPSPLLEIQIEQFGGHVGFIDLWPLRHLLPEMIIAELQKSVNSG